MRRLIKTTRQPTTTTAIDVYDAGGTAYLATVYYVKTANPEANAHGSTYNDMVNQPSSKWQTYIVIDGQVLEQNSNKQTTRVSLYVNQYGELKLFSEVAGEIQPGKTPKFIFDDLSDVQESTLFSRVQQHRTPWVSQGFNFFQDQAAAGATFTADWLISPRLISMVRKTLSPLIC